MTQGALKKYNLLFPCCSPVLNLEHKTNQVCHHKINQHHVKQLIQKRCKNFAATASKIEIFSYLKYVPFINGIGIKMRNSPTEKESPFLLKILILTS